ncbi:MAG: hypothetical protein AB7O56_00545 [Bauldia sp.]
MRRLNPGRLVRVAIAAAGLALVPSVASAQCVQQTGLEITVDPAGAAGGWCVAGALTAGDEHNVHATVDSPGLWQVALEALPGQIGVVVLAADDTGLWEGLLAGDGLAISPPLLLAAGDYRIALATAEGMMIYRVRLTPAEALPAAMPAAVADDFAGMLGATGAEVAIPWTVRPVEEGGLWTVSAQTLVGGYLNVTLRDAAGTTVTWSNLANEAGVLVLPDIALPPGDYELLVSGPPEGAPILLAAAMDVRPPGFAAEPDELPEIAHPLMVGSPATGRLATGGAGNDNDFFVVEIAEGTPSRLYDFTATAPSDAELRLALTDDQRTVLFERSGNRQVDLRGLALGPGRHFFRVTGSLPSDVTYTFLVEEAGEAVAGAEIEPNDIAERATLLPASGPVAGTFAGTDRDYLLLGVAGEMQLWDIEATGTGLASITLYDGADQVIATTNVNPRGRVARLSRILLPPGRNIVRVDGTDGSWLLRATPRGPPVPGEEIEPNDEQSRALALRLGSAQTGWLDRPNDGDMYAFNLAAPHHVRLTLEGPADFPLRAEIAWGDATNRIAAVNSYGALGEPQRVVWDGLLPPGDFILEVWAYDGVAREPYALTLEPLPFHDRPADFEPNNVAWQASPLRAGQVAEAFSKATSTGSRSIPRSAPAPWRSAPRR